MPWCVAAAFPGQVCMRGAADICSAACFQAHSNSCQARAFETSPPAYAAFEPLPCPQRCTCMCTTSLPIIGARLLPCLVALAAG